MGNKEAVFESLLTHYFLNNWDHVASNSEVMSGRWQDGCVSVADQR